MSLNKVLTATAAVILLSVAAAEAQTPTRMSQFDAWGSYSYGSANGKVCYILSTPTTKEPASVDHGDIFFLVSQKPGKGTNYEPQVVMGYQMKEGSKVLVDIDGKKYSLFTRGESAWMDKAEEEPELIASLRSGKSMKVDAFSKRGTATHYTYSLAGVTAALKSISTCK